MQGLGVDIVSLKAFDEIVTGSQAFLERHFTKAEQMYAERGLEGPLKHLAARYAAKEALVKALESSLLFRPPLIKSVNYTEIEVAHDPYGRPYFEFHGAMKDVIQKLSAKVLLSLSHDGDYAVAQVFVE